MKSSIALISELSGFSAATVSNALNNKKGVNKETVTKIMKIAKDVGYLSDNFIESIKVVIYKNSGEVLSDTPFFAQLMEGIEEESRANGYNTEICNLYKNSVNHEMMLSQILNDPSSAILLLATEMNKSDLVLFEEAMSPVVVIDGWFDNMKFDSVLINNTDSVYNAVKYLIDKGHRKIGYLMGNVRISNFFYREIGYSRAILQYGLEIDNNFRIPLAVTMDGAYNDMKKYLEKNPSMPTAFFADNDIIALGTMKALKEAGYKIPEEISIVGFDDMPFCEISSPSLTTVKVFKQEMGKMAVRQLISKIKIKDKISYKIQVSTVFVERDSVCQKLI